MLLSSMSSSITLPLNPSLHLTPRPFFSFSLSIFSSPKLSSSRSFANSFICSSSLNSASNDREELRWLREEQRWLREEERWIREEQRWCRERESLLQEIAELKQQIQALERGNLVQGGAISLPETVANVAGLLQVLKEKNLIAEGGTSTISRILFGESSCEEDVEVEKEAIAEEVVRFSDESTAEKEVKNLSDESKAEKEVKHVRKSLKFGSEGAEVLAMQEELLRLGFYSGEEDMEFSSFSDGTQRAVKTWQASSGFREDGIMTPELLEILYKEEVTESAGSVSKTDEIGNIPTDKKESENGAVVNSITEISEIQKTIVNQGSESFDLSQQRVFLLGENRWEDPTRLHSSNGKASDGKTKDLSTKCLTCRGEGRLLCTECDGTGEPNIEPQFLEWVGEETKCPYCEGHGYITCDVCQGKTVP